MRQLHHRRLSVCARRIRPGCLGPAPLAAACTAIPILAHAQCGGWSNELTFGTGYDLREVHAIGTWDPDGPGPLPPRLVVGGQFVTGSPVLNHIALWDGATWQPLASGMNGGIRGLATWDPDASGPQIANLVAGGGFSTAGGLAAKNIARWNGVSWQPLGTGLNDIVNALNSWDPDGFLGPAPSELIAAGAFTQVGPGGTAIPYVGRWNGSAWSALAAGPGTSVHDMTLWDSNIVVGDALRIVVAASSTLMYWDGSAWQGIPALVTGATTVLPWDHDGSGNTPARLVLGGPGGIPPLSGIAQWDGAAWQPIGSGFNSGVVALAIADLDGSGPGPSRLVAAGPFTSAGGPALNRIAYWDGTNWLPLGSGLDNQPEALGVWDPDGSGPFLPQVVVGGEFTAAGSLPALGVAIWSTLPPRITAQPGSSSACVSGGAAFSVTAVGGGSFSYQWQVLTAPNTWMTLSASAQPLPCGGSALANPPNASAAQVRINACSGLNNYQVRCIVSNGCGATTSSEATYTVCYANCDCSTVAPVLTGNDFICFLTGFTGGDPFANCDGSSTIPTLTANDFICFISAYATGCS
jgi:hypothetical protein